MKPVEDEIKEYYYPNYAVTRKQKRYIADVKMAEAGMTKYRHHSYSVLRKGTFEERTKNPSYFAQHWREYVEEN